MFSRRCIIALVGALALLAVTGHAQDYDDEGFNNNQNNNQGDNDGYGNSGYGNDDSYSGNAGPHYQQNVDSDGSNNQPTNYSPQSGNDNDGDYDNDDGAAASAPAPVVTRIKRSIFSGEQQVSAASAPKIRVKRHGKGYIGPVYTYVKTDKHANFKWGVKHKVGKKHHG